MNCFKGKIYLYRLALDQAVKRATDLGDNEIFLVPSASAIYRAQK